MPPPTYATGHLLVSRYRIQQLLGIGDTAEVYLAEDQSLQRTVVVKVLLPRLAGYEDVRRAFRERIIKAATLSHSHLARVFDGGQESGSIFMICEYLSGGSLEDVLSSGRTLSVDDGARLGRDVGSALAYLHENGLVHGALSPSKLLLDEEGRVRVSDIALAGIGREYRERMTLDDVRFLSPEQAVGEPANSRSDVYALALIIYEAVTGITPFDGVTPEAVLRARINATLPMRPELGSLDMLLAQAAVSDPRQRLDAEVFASRIGAVVSDFAPLVIPPSRGEVPLLSQYRPSEPRNSVGFRPPSPDQITGATAVVASIGRTGAPRHARPANEWVTSSSGGRRGGRDIDDLDYARLPPSRRLIFLVAALILLVVAIGGGIAWKVGLFSSNNSVPNFVGVNLADYENAAFTSSAPIVSLRSTMKADGFVIAIKHANSSSVRSGTIMSQSPVFNTEAKSGQVITVTVSDGTQTVHLPAHLIGETCREATPTLEHLHLSVLCPASQMISSSTALGRIARVVNSAGRSITTAPIHSTVILERSTGPASTTTTLAATTTTSPPVTTTTVAQMVAVPNVVGMDQAQTNAAMHTAVLYYTTSGPGSSLTHPTWTKVVAETPVAGTKVKKLSSVRLTVTK